MKELFLQGLASALALSLASLFGLGVPLAAAQSAASGADGPGVTGTWKGTLGGQLEVVFHLRRGGEGALSATMDVPAQGAEGLPVSTAAATGDSLRLEVASAGIVFAGQVQDDGETVEGTWQQNGQSLPLVLERTSTDAGEVEAEVAEVRQPGEPDVAGRWMGRIATPTGQKLRVVFNIEEADDGTLTATAKSPDQSDQSAPASALALTEDSLRVEAFGAVFEGKIGADVQAIEGTFEQGGFSTPLTLRRTEDDAAKTEEAQAERRRPQEPQPPFPYDSEDVTYPGGAEGVTLAATLTTPEGAGPHPAVVLISGSGPQNRNAETPGFDIGHKPFLVLADYLTRRGIAVLRYDERGIGRSTGSLAGLTSEDLAGDVQAGLDYLRSRSDLKLGKLGLVGHSEGGLIAPMLAARSGSAVDFLVLLAGPSVRGDEIIAEQVERLALANDRSPEKAAEQRAAQERILAAVTQAPDSAAAAERVRAVLKEEGVDAGEASARMLTSPWYRRFLSYNPRPALRKLGVPVLALYGTKDVQVPADQNAPAARDALANDPDATVKVLPGLNHLFQTAETGSPNEYGQIEETFAPAALEMIGDWIAAHTKAGE